MISSARPAALMSILSFTVLAVACGDAATPDAAEIPKVWELTGFREPESALLDSKAGVIYVSNVGGSPLDKDGNGFISKLTPDGKIATLEWVKGLDAPKGLALANGRLYAADIDQVVEIDTSTGAIAARHPAAGAKFLNDVDSDAEGRVYISDMATNVIWRLENGKLEKWLDSADLKHPNGLLLDGGSLLVGSWGGMPEEGKTKPPGVLLRVSLADKSIAAFGDEKFEGGPDGMEPAASDGYLLTDWLGGKVYRIDAAGKANEIMSLGQGSADLGYDPATKTAYIPHMKKGLLTAYKIE